MNFTAIREMSEAALARAKARGADLQFYITTNGTLITEAIADFFDRLLQRLSVCRRLRGRTRDRRRGVRLLDQGVRKLAAPTARFCDAGGSFLGVQSDGRVYPCLRARAVVEERLALCANSESGAGAPAKRKPRRAGLSVRFGGVSRSGATDG
jgi:sulfatase maturation enzyme AslB (radical SAM superfamily)